MKLTFNHIHIENFMSFQSTDIDLGGNGFVVVTGENQNESDGASSNGSGKSSIFEAIFWCLTGTTIRGSKDVVNHQFERQGCFVELDFNIDDKIINLIRAKDHSKYKTNLLISVNGKDISGKGIRDSQKIFEDTFPELSSDLIGSVVILGQGLPHRFTSNTPSGRKQVLEQLTNSDFMIESLKTRLNKREVTIGRLIKDKELTISNLNGQKLIIENVIHSLETQKENSRKNEIKLQIEEKIKTKAELSSKLEEASISLSQLSESCDLFYKSFLEEQSKRTSLLNYEQVEINKVSNSYSPRLSEINAEINSLNAYIRKAESIKDVCPTCGQKLQGVQKIDCTAEREKIKTLQTEQEELQAKQESELAAVHEAYKVKLDESLGAVMIAQTTSNNLRDQKAKTQITVNNLTTSIKQLEISINSLNVQLAKEDIDFDKEILRNQDLLSDLNTQLLYINNELESLNQHLSVIKKFQTFAKRDFRGYLLEQYITFLNKVAKKYCTSLFNSDNILISLDGNNLAISYSEKEYESLSGGEKQKVDLLIQFSIRDMLKNILGFSANILVLDEITDNLDFESCQKLITFISTSFRDLESIYFISHRKDLDIPYDQIITVIKDSEGISRI